MEEKISKIIQHHEEARSEVYYLLTELNGIDLSKVSVKEKRDIREAIIRSEEEHTYRGIFIDELKNLL